MIRYFISNKCQNKTRTCNKTKPDTLIFCFLQQHSCSLVAYLFVLIQDLLHLIRIGQKCRSFPLSINTAAVAVLPARHIQCCASLCAGSSGSVHSQPEEFSQQLTVPTDLFRPISPHSHSDSESIPRLPPPRRTHTLSRTLRRQVTKSLCFRFLLSPSPVCTECVSVCHASGARPCAIQAY